MTGDPDLFSQYRMGDLTLPNRIVMAPMTRSRAGDADVPVSQTVTYYVQRASAGMIITEGSQVSPQGVGYMHTPGIYSSAQIDGWKKVTDAVPDIVSQFKQAAENAKTAGFDGVEIHGANSYLLDQFLRSGSNKRTDIYGGNLENRTRLPLEVTKAVIGVWGGDRVGYRISPHNTAHSMSDTNPRETFSYFTKELNIMGVGYLHLIEPIGGRAGFVPPEARLGPILREIFKRTFILNGGYDIH